MPFPGTDQELATPIPTPRRPHLWSCRHCGMVDDYRTTREAQLQLAEGRYDQPQGRDEMYRPVVFKDWLQAYQWEHESDPTQPSTASDQTDNQLGRARAALALVDPDRYDDGAPDDDGADGDRGWMSSDVADGVDRSDSRGWS